MNKNYAISILRAIALLLIVFHHSFCYNAGLWNNRFPNTLGHQYTPFIDAISFIGLFLFTYISGYIFAAKILSTSQYNNSLYFIKKKVKRLFFPYVIWGGVLMFLPGESYMGFFYGMEHLWYLPTIFELFIFFYLTKKIWIKMDAQVCWIAMCCFILATACIYHFKPHLIHGRTLLYLPSFFFGIICFKTKLLSSFQRQIIVFFVSLLLFIVLYSYKLLAFYSIPLFGLVLSVHVFLGRLISSGLIKNSLIEKIIMTFYVNSMGVYIFHNLFILFLLMYIPQVQLILDKFWIIGPMILFLGICLISFLFSSLINRCATLSRILFG